MSNKQPIKSGVWVKAKLSKKEHFAFKMEALRQRMNLQEAMVHAIGIFSVSGPCSPKNKSTN